MEAPVTFAPLDRGLHWMLPRNVASLLSPDSTGSIQCCQRSLGCFPEVSRVVVCAIWLR